MKYLEAAQKLIDAKTTAERATGTIRGLRLTLIDSLGAHLGDVELAEITPDDLDEWAGALKDEAGLAPSTRRLYVTRVKEFFIWASRRGLVPKDPTLTLELPAIEGRAPKFLGASQYKALWGAADPPTRDFLDFMVCTGLRIGEALALTQADVGGEGLKIESRKGRDWMVLPVPECLKAHLLAMPPGEGGRIWRYSKPTYADMLDGAVEKGGLNLEVTNHWLRHTCATWLVRAGVPIYTVKVLLGHQSVQTTERYARIPNGNWAEEVKLLPERTRAWQPLFTPK